jgi:hypothetical protein
LGRESVLYVAAVLSFMMSTGCNIDNFWGSERQVRQAPLVTDTAVYTASDQVMTPVNETPPSKSPPTRTPVAGDREEVDLVEELLQNRNAYHRSLHRLRDYYAKRGYATKLSWAEFEIKGVRKVKPFRYLLDSEVPSQGLRPVAIIPEADELYAKGVELMKRGGHGVPALYREDLMIEASEVLRSLVTRYPESDKIDDAAFLLGEIHKEYLPQQEPIAVEWYERAWTWNPQTPHPARFQAAVVRDYRLHDRDGALELYQAVVDQETSITSNVRFAMRRIYELSQE